MTNLEYQNAFILSKQISHIYYHIYLREKKSHTKAQALIGTDDQGGV